MKSLRNIFKSKTNSDKPSDKKPVDPRRVTFQNFTPKKRHSTRSRVQARPFVDDTVLISTYAYDVPTAPRERVPLRSCPGAFEEDYGGYDSEYEAPPRKPSSRFAPPPQRQQYLDLGRLDLDYNLDDPSPVRDESVIRPSTYQQLAPAEALWKSKYQSYKSRYREMAREQEELKKQLEAVYADHRQQMTVLTDRLQSVSMERDTLKRQLEYSKPAWSPYPHPAGYPPHPMTATFFPRNPQQHEGFSTGAGEHLASSSTVPSTSSAQFSTDSMKNPPSSADERHKKGSLSIFDSDSS